MLTPKLIAGIIAFVNAQEELQRAKVVLNLASLVQERHANLASVSPDYIACIDNNDRQVMIIGSMTEKGYIFRSVLRRKQRFSKMFAWFCNGQASTGAEEIAFYGEELVYVPSVEELDEKLTFQYANSRRVPDISALIATMAHRPQ